MNITSVKRTFVPVVITLNTEVEVANVLGALASYGSASVYAENTLKDIGLGHLYSGNVRKASRKIALDLTESVGGNTDLLKSRFKAYRKSAGRTAKFSKAGKAAAGTPDDLSKGRTTSTTFETR